MAGTLLVCLRRDEGTLASAVQPHVLDGARADCAGSQQSLGIQSAEVEDVEMSGSENVERSAAHKQVCEKTSKSTTNRASNDGRVNSRIPTYPAMVLKGIQSMAQVRYPSHHESRGIQVFCQSDGC